MNAAQWEKRKYRTAKNRLTNKSERGRLTLVVASQAVGVVAVYRPHRRPNPFVSGQSFHFQMTVALGDALLVPLTLTVPENNRKIIGNLQNYRKLPEISKLPEITGYLPLISGKLIPRRKYSWNFLNFFFSRARENFVQTESQVPEICSQSMFSNKIRLKVRRCRILKKMAKWMKYVYYCI